MSKNIDKIKSVGFDEISELYFNYDWEKGNTLEFISNLGMTITTVTIKTGSKGI